jgi:PAS domain S-box-containing protein
MRTAIAQAGAERGLLILSRETGPRIEAEATTGGDPVQVRLRDVPVTAEELPESVLHYVMHTRESVNLDDAATQPSFAADPYVRQHQVRSILCLPLTNQAKLIGVLYLENNLAPRAFAPARVAVLKLLASQAAISLENIRLYRNLERREAKIRGLFDANIIAIFIGDVEGQVIEANDAFFNMLGYDREDVASGRVHRTKISPLEWRDRDVRTRAELETSGRVEPFEKEYWRKDGSRVPVLVGAAVFEPDRVVAFVLDISERKRAEKALRQSEEQWKAVFENNPTMYFMVDTNGVIASVNPLGAEQLGFTVDELVGHPVLDLFQAEDREAVERNAAICFKQPGQTMSWEARKVRKNGEVLWVRETARVMLIKERPVALIVCEDITERKRVSEALREIQRDLAHANRLATMGQLTASITHEVNQPISATITNAHAALRWLDGPSPNLEEVPLALARILRDGKRAGEVIERIRALVRKAPPRKDRLKINGAIREVIELTRVEAMKSGVSVQTELAKGLPAIEGDRVGLQQVILNLIINAVEAMSGVSEGPRDLLVSSGNAGSDGVLVAVRDSGPGLAPAALDRVFDAFNTTKPNGLGLGLSICRSIIEAHGGRLWASANEPCGAIFQFTVPAHPNAAS